jgi:hypothetical protein
MLELSLSALRADLNASMRSICLVLYRSHCKNCLNGSGSEGKQVRIPVLVYPRVASLLFVSERVSLCL